MAIDRSCAGCSFWKKDEESEVEGQCRRSFPRQMSPDGTMDGVWPTTTDDDWCGDFLPNDQTEKETINEE